jgi:hypothetical protein
MPSMGGAVLSQANLEEPALLNETLTRFSGGEAIEAFPPSRRAVLTSFARDVQPTGPGIQ